MDIIRVDTYIIGNNTITSLNNDFEDLDVEYIRRIFNEISLRRLQKQNKVLTEQQFAKLQTKPYNDLNKDGLYISEKCEICLEDYTESTSVTVLGCKHCFCTKCIKNWLLSKNKNCPKCRN